MNQKQQEALDAFADKPTHREIVCAYAVTARGRAKIAKSAFDVLRHRDEFIDVKYRRGYQWCNDDLTLFVKVEKVLLAFCAPAELRDGDVARYLSKLNEVRAKLRAPKDGRKAVCQRHGQAYVMSEGCSYCED